MGDVVELKEKMEKDGEMENKEMQKEHGDEANEIQEEYSDEVKEKEQQGEKRESNIIRTFRKRHKIIAGAVKFIILSIIFTWIIANVTSIPGIYEVHNDWIGYYGALIGSGITLLVLSITIQDNHKSIIKAHELEERRGFVNDILHDYERFSLVYAKFIENVNFSDDEVEAHQGEQYTLKSDKELVISLAVQSKNVIAIGTTMMVKIQLWDDKINTERCKEVISKLLEDTAKLKKYTEGSFTTKGLTKLRTSMINQLDDLQTETRHLLIAVKKTNHMPHIE